MILRSNNYVLSQYVCELYIKPRLRQFVTLTLAQKSARRISLRFIHNFCACTNISKNYTQMLHMQFRHKIPPRGKCSESPPRGKCSLRPPRWKSSEIFCLTPTRKLFKVIPETKETPTMEISKRAEAKIWKNESKWQVELYVPEEQTSVAVVNSKKEAMHIMFDWIRDLTHVDFVVYTGTGRQEFVGTKLNDHVRRFT